MVYNSMRMWQGANGVSLYEGIVSPAYTVLMPKQPISNGYFAALFKSPNIINEFRKNSQGLTSDTWNLKYPQIKAIKVLIPSLSEQEKIADMIAILEKRIAKQAQLVDIFKKYKRGLSDMLFSSISITPNCKRILWKNVFLLLQNNTFSRDDLIQYGGTVCDIHYGDMLVKYGATVNLSSTDIPYIKPEKDISKFSINSYLQNGDIVIADTAEDYSVGKATEIISLDGIMALSGLHTIPCRPCIEFAPMYLGYYLNSSYFRRQLYPMIQGTKVSSISKSEIAKTEILVPSKLEQRRIASILYGLDQKIEYEENQTKALVHIKSAFLQQLFI